MVSNALNDDKLMTKLTCISPIDGSVVAERDYLTLAAAELAIHKAAKAQKAWAKQSLEQRIDVVSRAVANIGQMNNEIVPELAWQMGRPVRYGGEFSGFEERALYMASIAADALAPIDTGSNDQFQRHIHRVPHGVMLIVAPWNYPFMTVINSAAPALMAGNTVVLKHASQTPLVGERLEQAFLEAGAPEGVFQNLCLDHGTTSSLIAGNAFDYLSFTGSVHGGQSMETSAAGTFTGMGLELGGKDPGYVMDDADVAAAADTLIDGAMFNSGQSCCGIERIYVAESVFDDFVQKATDIVNGYRLGNPLETETTLGPMAHKRFAALVREQTQAAIAAGAKPLINTFAEDDGGAYLSPQLLINVDHSMTIMRDETFGPVVGIMAVKDDAEALALMNDSEFGLTASLWTTDIDRATALANDIDTGTVFMNRCDYLDPSLCWTGVKNTGRGGSLSEIGFHNVTRPKSYHFKKN